MLKEGDVVLYKGVACFVVTPADEAGELIIVPVDKMNFFDQSFATLSQNPIAMSKSILKSSIRTTVDKVAKTELGDLLYEPETKN